MKINSMFLLLPIVIIREIFSRLPVDSALECKLVCKSLRDLIDDHHHGSNNSNIVETAGGFLLRRRCMQRGFYYGEYDDKVTCFNLTKEPVFNHDQQYPFEEMTRNKWCIFASCNGLIWHGERDGLPEPRIHREDMYVSNPYTGEHAKLPILNYNPKLDVNIIYGFGYHPTTKQYKLIRICYRESSVRKGHVQVYTLGSGTPWRSIGEIEHELYRYVIYGHKSSNNSWGILLNGVLYWLTMDEKLIISFDLEDEEFGVIPSILPVFHGISALGVLSGCLCLNSKVLDSMHVWVMNNKDYSWSKKFIISWNQCTAYFPLVAYLESGNFLLHNDFDKIISEHFGKLQKIDERFHIIPYTKSSISLKALGEKEVIQVKAEEENRNKKNKKQGRGEDQQQLKRRKINKLIRRDKNPTWFS